MSNPNFYMKPTQTLTSAQVRAVIESGGTGDSFKAKLRDVSTRVHCNESTLYRYLKIGAAKGSTNALLRQIAMEYDIVGHEPGEGQMII